MHPDNIDVMNPEDLLQGSVSSSEMFDDFVSPRELAQILTNATVVNVGKLLREYSDAMPDDARDGVVRLLAEKVYEATPDELEEVRYEAQRQRVWPLIKRHVMQRNNKHAQDVHKCENLASFDMLLSAIAKSGSLWLPSPVYHTAGKVLERFVNESTTVTEIDRIQNTAKKWRLLEQIKQAVRGKDQALLRAAERHKSTCGYRLQSGRRYELLQSTAEALRKVENGSWVFMD